MGFLGLQDLKVKPEARFSPAPSLPTYVTYMKPHPISEMYVGAERRALTASHVTWAPLPGFLDSAPEA